VDKLAPAPRLVVPAYFHPAVAPQDWATLATLARQVRLVILNVASGPGAARDPAFTDVLAVLHRGGVAVAGYVDTDYGRRPARAVGADVARYRSWYPQVRAVFLDRVAATGDLVGHYAGVARSARTAGMETVVFHHGVHPDPAYAAHADLLGTFEGPWTSYRNLAVPWWARSGPREQFLHLVHTVPAGLLPTARRLAASRNAGAAYATDLPGIGPDGQNPWRRLRCPVQAGREP
jgi:Spherulation-specific family 4